MLENPSFRYVTVMQHVFVLSELVLYLLNLVDVYDEYLGILGYFYISVFDVINRSERLTDFI